LPKHPPNALHKSSVEGLVPGLEVDPPSHPLDRRLPLSSIAHDDLPAGGIVLVNPHGQDVLFALDIEGFVDFMLYRQTVRVPAEAALDVVPGGVSMARDNVLEKVVVEMCR